MAGTIAKQGYVALGNNDNVFYPSIGVNAAGKGVMTFSISGHHYYPSAAYTRIDAVNGAGDIHLAAAGARADRRPLRVRRVRRRRCRALGRLLRCCRRGGRIDLDCHGMDSGHVRLHPFLANWGTFVGNVSP